MTKNEKALAALKHIVKLTDPMAGGPWLNDIRRNALDGISALESQPVAGQVGTAESEWRILKHELDAKGDVDTAPWTVSDSTTYRGFFMHGWERAISTAQQPQSLVVEVSKEYIKQYMETELQEYGVWTDDVIDAIHALITSNQEPPHA